MAYLAREHRRPGLAAAFLLFLLAGLLHAAPAMAQVDDSPVNTLSPPLIPPLGDPVYTESPQTGPSSSLFAGDNNLTSPSLRTGISDPLGFLIETNTMSPYLPDDGMVSSYADAALPQPLLNDEILASRYSEYRSNRLLMAGAGTASTLASAASAAGGTTSMRGSAASSPLALSGFSRIGAAVPFAAGSIAVSQQGAGAGAGMGSSFVDPNSLAVQMSSSAGVAAMQADPDAANAALSGMQSGMPVTADTMGMSQAAVTSAAAVVPTSMVLLATVPSASSMPVGAEAGEVFPNVSQAAPSGSGFPDSTMGTAGLSYPTPDMGFTSPLLIAGTEGDLSHGPFHSLGEEGESSLQPTLLGASAKMGSADTAAMGGGASGGLPLSPSASGASFEEVVRKARMHAMIETPGAPMPSSFALRALKRQYERQQGAPVRRHTTLTAPSVTP